MLKGQNYANHFKESGLNRDFDYKTKQLDIPEGNNENLDLLENVDEDTEAQNDEVNDEMEKKLSEVTLKYGKSQYEEFVKMNEVIWIGN